MPDVSCRGANGQREDVLAGFDHGARPLVPTQGTAA